MLFKNILRWAFFRVFNQTATNDNFSILVAVWLNTLKISCCKLIFKKNLYLRSYTKNPSNLKVKIVYIFLSIK